MSSLSLIHISDVDQSGKMTLVIECAGLKAGLCKPSDLVEVAIERLRYASDVLNLARGAIVRVDIRIGGSIEVTDSWGSG